MHLYSLYVAFTKRQILGHLKVLCYSSRFRVNSAVKLLLSFTTYGLIQYYPVLGCKLKTSLVNMPKGGRKGGHKGRARMYTSPEEIDAQMKAEKEKKMQEEEEGVGAAQNDTAEEKHPGSGSDDSDDDSSRRRGGVEGLIDIENPNRVTQKAKKVSQIELDEPKQLSRREREEIEKQKAKAHYMKLHYAGKTDEAKADLARLAIIRREREEAARKKEGEKKAKEAAAAASKGLHSLSLK